jgi:hypothetical protein
MQYGQLTKMYPILRILSRFMYNVYIQKIKKKQQERGREREEEKQKSPGACGVGGWGVRTMAVLDSLDIAIEDDDADGDGHNMAIQPIESTAMAGEQIAAILDAYPTLEPTFQQVSRNAE